MNAAIFAKRSHAAHNASDMIAKRIAAIFVIACTLLLSSGALSRVHEAAHAIEDQRALDASHDGSPAPVVPAHHDDTNCFLHAQLLNTPFVPVGIMPILVLLGLFVAFLTQIPQSIERRFVADRIDCRGPPRC